MVGRGEKSPSFDPGFESRLLRGVIVNRIYGTHKNLYIYLFLITIFGPIYYGPPFSME